MAKKAKKVKTAKGAELRIVNPDAAGIDIADGIMQVCVPADRSKDNNRAFGAYTSDLHAGKSSVSCPLKPSDSAPLKHSTMPP